MTQLSCKWQGKATPFEEVDRFVPEAESGPLRDLILRPRSFSQGESLVGSARDLPAQRQTSAYINHNSESADTLAIQEVFDELGKIPANVYRITRNVSNRQLVTWSAVNSQLDSADNDQAMLMRWTTQGSTYEFRPAVRVGNLSEAIYYTSV